jgi:hypothetical protein
VIISILPRRSRNRACVVNAAQLSDAVLAKTLHAIHAKRFEALKLSVVTFLFQTVCNHLTVISYRLPCQTFADDRHQLFLFETTTAIHVPACKYFVRCVGPKIP